MYLAHKLILLRNVDVKKTLAFERKKNGLCYPYYLKKKNQSRYDAVWYDAAFKDQKNIESVKKRAESDLPTFDNINEIFSNENGHKNIPMLINFNTLSEPKKKKKNHVLIHNHMKKRFIQKCSRIQFI